ncbi:MAG: hypothetical protein JHC95_11725 [Solirubrobacteraceae bacterium]|nr:hypothetical protein [Solirubrobacteraceae bacterium]
MKRETEPPAEAGAPPDDSGVLCRLGPRGERMLVAFGGIAGTGDEPTFEFGRTAHDLPMQRLNFRDHERSWYHRGVRDVGGNIGEIEDWLRAVIADAAPERLVMVGASAGGYAAMLFGHRLGADTVHAFGPQTFIDPDMRAQHHEPRWDAETSALMRSGRYDARYGDLAAVLRDTPPADPRTRHHVWYCSLEQPDAVHASHVADLSAVTLHHFTEGWHEIARWLRDRGRLTEILTASLEGRPIERLPEEADPVLLERPTRTWLARRRWRKLKRRGRPHPRSA